MLGLACGSSLVGVCRHLAAVDTTVVYMTVVSICGPTLFVLFINDIDDIVFGTSVCMKLFADDVKLYSSFYPFIA